MKVLLLDADGVVLNKGEYFSERFAREHDVPLESVRTFFAGPFGGCQTGEKDLKEEIRPYLEAWNWQGSVDDFLAYWFQDVQVDPNIEPIIKELRDKGVRSYLASNNEHYRARKIEAKLGDMLDGCFFSADLKSKKENPDFFKYIIEKLEVEPMDAAFVDNDQKNVDAAASLGIRAYLYDPEILNRLSSDS
jgi:HAD superfamily hydrolase (TIGR01509 family)